MTRGATAIGLVIMLLGPSAPPRGARFSLPPGSRLELTGRYPYGRYMSLNAS